MGSDGSPRHARDTLLYSSFCVKAYSLGGGGRQGGSTAFLVLVEGCWVSSARVRCRWCLLREGDQLVLC